MSKGKLRIGVFLAGLLSASLISIAGQAMYEFHKLNPGIRSGIKRIFAPDSSCTYLLTDRVFIRQGKQWSRLNIPEAKGIHLFYPAARGDYWFTVNTALNSTEIYHYYSNRLEKIASPLANEINAIYFTPEGDGFFAGWGEIHFYSGGLFRILSPPPGSREIDKIQGFSDSDFWFLNFLGELYHFTGGSYKQLLAGEKVRDFLFTSAGNGYILTTSAIYHWVENKCISILRSGEFENANRIAVFGEDFMIVGKKGFLAQISNGKLNVMPVLTDKDLYDICVTPEKEIWICGDKGVVLYSGPRDFNSAVVDVPIFVPHNIFKYTFNANDEYGVAVDDFNGDGRSDIYAVCIFNPNRLFINAIPPRTSDPKGELFFEEAREREATGNSEKVPPDTPLELQLGAAAADVDNDGDQDLYICALNAPNKLLLNKGKGYFRDVSQQPDRACPDMNRSNAAAFADVDADGDLDLFVTSEKASNRLFLNDGTGRFTDVTSAAGLQSERGGMCASFADINMDGLPDLCVTFWLNRNRLYLNESRDGHIRFRDISRISGIADEPAAKSNGVAFGDVNNDGLPDLFICNRSTPNKLYLNRGNGLFRDVTERYFGNRIYLSYGVVFADFDLDGWMDLYLSNLGENVLFRNDAGQRFTDATDAFGADRDGYFTGSATGDFDSDGDPDLYVACFTEGYSTLFINSMSDRHSIKIIPKGTASNRDAVGTKIYLYLRSADGIRRLAGYREITSGSGYASVSAREGIFGVSSNASYSAKIVFPASGKTVELDTLRAGEVHYVNEETGVASFRNLAFKAIFRFFFDRESRLEIVKYILAFALIGFSVFMHRKKSVRYEKVFLPAHILLLILFVILDRIFLYQILLVSFYVPLVVVLLGISVMRLVSERILIRRKSEKEKQLVRENISRDLHDDLASTLGSIAIYSNTLRNEGTDGFTRFPQLADKIADLTQSALNSISDIIWMTSPKHDSLNSLFSKIRNYYFELFTDNKLEFKSQLSLPTHDIQISEKLRHHVFLIMKEIANNIIRHSKASMVSLKVSSPAGMIIVEVKDNGIGFDLAHEASGKEGGNGLLNMRRRAEESGILLKIDSTAGKGTRIDLSFKIT